MINDLKLNWSPLPEALEESKKIIITTAEDSDFWANAVSQDENKFYAGGFNLGTVIYVNSKNELHRLDGPALKGIDLRNQKRYREWFFLGEYIGSDQMDFNQEEFKEFLKQKGVVSSLKLDKQADLYNNILYTVVPRDMSLEFGIYPQDQKFHSSYVFLWDTYADLNNFDEDKWKKLRVTIPQDAKENHTFTRIVGSTVGVEYIPNSWELEEQKINSLYNE